MRPCMWACCCMGQGRIFGDPMTYDTMMKESNGDVTFVPGGLYVIDYESPGYAPPHPAHFKASFVNLHALLMANDSGLAPPMDFAFTSGVGFCNLLHCDPGWEYVHFNPGTQQMFKLGIHPGAEMVTEGERRGGAPG
jgi:hypothetical protein